MEDNKQCDMWCDMIEHEDINIKKNIILNSCVSLNNSSQSSIKFNIMTEQTQNEPNNLSVDEIINLNFTSIDELSLIKYQSCVISQLKKYIFICKNEKTTFDININLKKIKWLLDTTIFLSENRKLTKIKSKKHTIKKIIKRNSYEFCEKKHLCQYHETLICKKKHFVYNFIACDIEELIYYLENNATFVSIDEIFTTINTLCYVINHMRDELSLLQ